MTPTQARYILTGLVLILVLVGVVFLARLTRPHLTSPQADFPKAQGPLNAPIQIVEYSDFQCPACQRAQPVLAQLLGQYPGKVRLVFQHFPISGHRWSGLAHHAAECAARQGHFWEYQDRLYAQQSTWSTPVQDPVEFLLRYAKESSLDLDGFAHCLSDPGVETIIREESRAGVGLGVRSTPSFFVNGKIFLGEENLRKEVERLAAK